MTFFKILLSYHKRELLWWVGSHCINLPLFNTDSQLLLSKKQLLICWNHCFNTESIIHISIQNNRKTTSFLLIHPHCEIVTSLTSPPHVDMMNWLASSTTGEHQTSTQVKTKDSAQTDVQFLFCSHTLKWLFLCHQIQAPVTFKWEGYNSLLRFRLQ